MDTTGSAVDRTIAPSLPAALRRAHELFVAGQVDASYLAAAAIRRVVVESWQRSIATGVDPDLSGSPAAEALCRNETTLADMRAGHPLAATLPIIRRLLVNDAADSGVVVAVSAANGTLLWVEGDAAACRRAESMNFVPGADWSERGAGTNAPGTALALDREIQIRESEHFSRIVQPWTCTAVPVHDPATGALIGAVDLTGDGQVASPQALGLVRATVAAVEGQLALMHLTASKTTPATAQPRLAVLGSDRPRWIAPDDDGRVQSLSLTGRHADILVLLTRHPEGLSADHLALLLDEKDLDVVTVRAEMSRLRRVIGPHHLDSRPYRLTGLVSSDVSEVFDALAADDVEEALRCYAGPLLPQSVSPAIARVRTELSMSVRGAVLTAGRPALLRRWLETPEGRDDRDGWQMLHDVAGTGPAARARASGHLAGLDLELG
ncbi:GAF domain-containing protein [Mycolicibacterium tusciae]|nr:GAF domain-containing protein [Mycolicibacterium tusciae]